MMMMQSVQNVSENCSLVNVHLREKVK